MVDEIKTPRLSAEQGKRLYKALTATSDELFQVLLDQQLQVLHAALKNQSLNEEHLLALLKRRDLSEDLLKAIYQLDMAKGSHRLRVALSGPYAAQAQRRGWGGCGCSCYAS